MSRSTQHQPNRAWILAAVVLKVGCGGPVEESDLPQIGEQRAAIINGTEDQEHIAVGMLLHDSAGNPEDDVVCTATLIRPGYALTAAHCVTTRHPPFRKLDPLYLVVGYGAGINPATGVPSGSLYKVQDVEFHPAYAGGGVSDIAVVRLTGEVPTYIAQPLPLADAPPQIGDAVTLVGFGMLEPGNLSTLGRRRQATSVISRMNGTTFDVEGTAPNHGSACHGDSGGPSLRTTGRGEVVVGVHAGVDPDLGCGSKSTDMRVDAYHSWILGAMDRLAGDPWAQPEPAGEAPAGSGYGEPCGGPSDCQSHVCITVSYIFSSSTYCSQRCDPELDDCPHGHTCDASGVCLVPNGGKEDQRGAEVTVHEDGIYQGGCNLSSRGKDSTPTWFLLLLVLCALGLRRRRAL